MNPGQRRDRSAGGPGPVERGSRLTRRSLLVAGTRAIGPAVLGPGAMHVGASCRMTGPDPWLRSEIARVRRELNAFQLSLLPALLADRARVYHEGATRLVAVSRDPAKLRAWQAAAGRLLRALPRPSGLGASDPLDPAEFPGFLPDDSDGLPDEYAAPACAIWSGRIAWHIAPFPEWRKPARDGVARELLEEPGCPIGASGAPEGALSRALPRLRAWLPGLPAEELLVRSHLACGCRSSSVSTRLSPAGCSTAGAGWRHGPEASRRPGSRPRGPRSPRRSSTATPSASP